MVVRLVVDDLKIGLAKGSWHKLPQVLREGPHSFEGSREGGIEALPTNTQAARYLKTVERGVAAVYGFVLPSCKPGQLAKDSFRMKVEAQGG